MTKQSIIRGRIIRVVDSATVIVNLGRDDGVADYSIFRVIGATEDIVDPVTDEALGSMEVVKAKVRASQVYNRFTVATSKWTTYSVKFKPFGGAVADAVSSMLGTETETHGGDLRVNPDEVEPWQATTEETTNLGDEVEVDIVLDDEETPLEEGSA